MWSNNHFERHFLPHISVMHRLVLTKLLTVSYCRVDISKVMGSKVKITDNIYQICTFVTEAS